MFDRISRGWELMQQSLRVLSQDPELLVFPLISAVCFLAVGASFIVPMVLTGLEPAHAGLARTTLSAMHFVVMVGFYVCTYFVVTFFNVALVAAAGIRLRGGDPTLGDGLRAAASRFGQILAWSVLAATVGAVLRSLERQSDGLVGKLVSGLLGLAWSAATVLVVPVLAFEQVGPVDALKRSVELLKQTWGEELSGNAGIGLVSVLSVLGGVALVLVGVASGPPILYPCLVAALAVVGIGASVQAALHGIFQAAIYAYATTGQVPSAFSTELVQQAYRAR